MNQYDIDKSFLKLVSPIEMEIRQQKANAFVVETRPIPEGLISNGIPLGHIAFRGDFGPIDDGNLEDDQSASKQKYNGLSDDKL